MKKFSFLLWFILSFMDVFSQTATNADGTLKFRGNVAIIVEGRSLTFQNGTFVKQVEDENLQALKTALRTLCMQDFQNMCFAVVNRDDEAFKQVEQLISENKLEDYLDGFSVSAKSQGADYIFLVDITQYGEDNSATQFDISTRLMNVENNMGFHTFYRSEAISLNDENDMQKKAAKIIDDFRASFQDFLLNVFPEQYFVAKVDGKTWQLGAYQPNGRILPTDKFYAFRFQKEKMKLAQNELPIQVLEEVAICERPSVNGGYLQVKSDNFVSDVSNIVLFRNLSQPVFQGVNQMTMTFFGLNYEMDSYDGLIKSRINNAVFSAITRHAGLQLIEHDHLSELKEERELQKGEDFIDGHVVEQMKAIGVMYLIKLESYQRTEFQVSLKISLISVAENRIIRTVDVNTSIDNIENEMYKQICERIANPCVIKLIDKNTLEMSSLLTLKDGDDCILEMTKAVQNPMTGEVLYSVAELCTLTFEEYKGNKCILSIDKIKSKEDMENLEANSANGFITFRVDGTKIKSDLGTESDVKKQAGKKKKSKSSIWNKLKEVGKEAIDNVKVNIK